MLLNFFKALLKLVNCSFMILNICYSGDFVWRRWKPQALPGAADIRLKVHNLRQQMAPLAGLLHQRLTPAQGRPTDSQLWACDQRRT